MARTTIKTIVDNQPIINHGGYFTELMASFNRYIGEEYKQNRITGAQYAQVYLGGLQANLQAAFDYAKHQDAQDLEEQLAQEQLAQQKELTDLQRIQDKEIADAQLAKQDEWNVNQLAQQKDLTDLQRIQDKDLADAQLAEQVRQHGLDLAEKIRSFDAQLAKQDEWKGVEHDLQQQKLDLERELNETQQQLVRAQTQAFKARHNKDLAKLVFDVVTIGVTQEQMNILAGPNPIFGSVTPADAYAKAAWTDIP